MRGTEYIIQVLYDYLQTTPLPTKLKIYKFKRPEKTGTPVCVLSTVTGTSNTIQTFRCNVNIYVPSLLVGKTYYPDSATLAQYETTCVELLDHVTYDDCLISFADAPTYIECSESQEWLLNCSLNVVCK